MLKERIEAFDAFMNGCVSAEFRAWLVDNGFFNAPASRAHHGSEHGGLFEHSFTVASVLESMTKANGLMWRREESPRIVGMFHDLCKIDAYKEYCNEDGENEWKYNLDTPLRGHGDKSVMLLSQFMTLTEEEILCIRYHMGAFTDEREWGLYTGAIHHYPNVLWTHHADMIAAHVVGV